MKEIKRYGKQIAIFTITMIGSALIFSILQYFHLLSVNISHFLSTFLILLLAFAFGIINGKNADKNGYLEGIKIGGLQLITMILLNTIIFGIHFKLGSLLYYISILVLSVIGAMIGINKKKK
jgi:putative membrane protein (TIGR04086 family)